MNFQPKTTLDKVFEVGILIKAAHGVFEIIGGLLLLFIKPESISHLAAWITRGELAEDANSQLANYILHSAQGVTHGVLLFAAIYLLAHGIIKVVLVGEILHGRLWAYPGLIIVTAGFVLYQTYQLTLALSPWLILLTLFDLAIIYLTAREYAQRRQHRGTGAHTPE